MPPFNPIVVPSLFEGEAIANGPQAAECGGVGTQQHLFGVDGLRGAAGEGACARGHGFDRLRGKPGHMSRYDDSPSYFGLGTWSVPGPMFLVLTSSCDPGVSLDAHQGLRTDQGPRTDQAPRPKHQGPGC